MLLKVLLFSLISFVTACTPFPVVETGIAHAHASSVSDAGYDVSRIRLNYNQNREGGQGWLAAVQDTNQWVQLSMNKPVHWETVVTQGVGNVDEWTESFTISYTENGVDWINYHDNEIFTANNDRNSLVTTEFIPPIVARSIRVKPMTYNSSPAMRLEAYIAVPDLEYGEMVSAEPVPAIQSGLRVVPSTVFSPEHDASRIRLNFDEGGSGSNGWRAEFSDTRQWVQVSSSVPVWWSKVSTQGRGDADQWIKTYFISYSDDGIRWRYLERNRVFAGNDDRNSITTHMFQAPILAKAVRLHPITWQGEIATRMEFYFFENEPIAYFFVDE